REVNIELSKIIKSHRISSITQTGANLIYSFRSDVNTGSFDLFADSYFENLTGNIQNFDINNGTGSANITGLLGKTRYYYKLVLDDDYLTGTFRTANLVSPGDTESTGVTLLTGSKVGSGSKLKLSNNIVIKSDLDDSNVFSGSLSLSGDIEVEGGDWDGSIIPPSKIDESEIDGAGLTGNNVFMKLGAENGITLKSDENNPFKVSVELEDGEVGKEYDIYRSKDGMGWGELIASCVLNNNKVCNFETETFSYFVFNSQEDEEVDLEKYEVEFNLDPTDLDLEVKNLSGDIQVGSGNIYNLENGSYTYIASAIGYESEEGGFVINGTGKIINIELDITIRRGGGGGTNIYWKPYENDESEEDDNEDNSEEDDNEDESEENDNEDDSEENDEFEESKDDENIIEDENIVEDENNIYNDIEYTIESIIIHNSKTLINIPVFDSVDVQNRVNLLNKLIVNQIKDKRISGRDLSKFINSYNDLLIIIKIINDLSEHVNDTKKLKDIGRIKIEDILSILNDYDKIISSDNLVDDEFELALSFMNRYGLTNYTSVDDFRPDDELTLQEFIKFFVLFGTNVVGLEQVGLDMENANSSKLVNRSDVFVVLVKVILGRKLDESVYPNWYNYFEFVRYLGLTKEEDVWAQDRPITRYELALILYRSWLSNGLF
ncbi:hypothetical protein, partial [Candidatus Vampirococcus lugosii]